MASSSAVDDDLRLDALLLGDRLDVLHQRVSSSSELPREPVKRHSRPSRLPTRETSADDLVRGSRVPSSTMASSSTPRRRPSKCIWPLTASRTTILAIRPAEPFVVAAADAAAAPGLATKPRGYRRGLQGSSTSRMRAQVVTHALAVLDADAALRRVRPRTRPSASSRPGRSMTTRRSNPPPRAGTGDRRAPGRTKCATRSAASRICSSRTSSPAGVFLHGQGCHQRRMRVGHS